MSSQPKPTEPAQPKEGDLLALMKRAQAGDATALPALREFFRRPQAVEAMGDLARMSRENLLAKYTGNNLLIKEGVQRKMQAMRDEVAGANPTPLELLLVDRVVACWLHLYHLEITYAGNDSMSLELGAYYQRCISAAQKRYLSAIKTLAVVRKLALPVLQVNVARRQVNVAGTCAIGGSKEGTAKPQAPAIPQV